ncbi:potassium channel subfamily K member 1 isoform X2 [Lingula anatina]|nr:potassium channel subfamily K member 1 isoform X2 [Lingula anatina]|eukprot:XP_013410263.1 potassium channel subfamily K member 1 isoform X2 [Lingula anatina]
MPENNSSKWTGLRLALLVLFLVLYLVIGSVVFSALEGPMEQKEIDEIKKLRAEFLGNHSCISDAELERLIVKIVKYSERGVSAVRNATMEPNWSFGQSFFFAGTVLTTIGYGHVAPLSDGGKAFCIFYALIGIPLTLIMFTAIVERLNIPVTVFLQYLLNKMQHLASPFHIRLVHLFLVIGLVLLFIFLIPAAIFTALEVEWNYLDSFYYCFISMTTIGLGDYIPGEHPDQQSRTVYKIATTIYLYLGLIFMMLMIAVLYEIPELNLGIHFYMATAGSGDGETTYLQARNGGPNYTQQIDEPVHTITKSYKRQLTSDSDEESPAAVQNK